MASHAPCSLSASWAALLLVSGVGWLSVDRDVRAQEYLPPMDLGDAPGGPGQPPVLVVAPDRAEALAALLGEAGETVFRLGQVGGGKGIRYRGELA